MRIGIDCRMIGKGHGIGRYIEQLVLHLVEIDAENTFILFVNDKSQLPALPDERASRGRSIVNCQLSIVEVNIPWYSFAEQTQLSKIIKAQKLNLMHFPHWNVPLRYNDSFVLTIHDLTMFHYPRPEATTLGPIKFWCKDKAHRLVIRHAVRQAKHILVMSEWVKQDVHRTLGVPLAKMTTTYQAPFQNNAECRMQNAESVLKKYGVSRPYILYVGAAYPHKNLGGLLQAWKIFEEKYGNNYQLVLVGKEDYFYQRIKLSAIRYPLSAITFTGLVPDDKLAVLYEQASLYVFPSLSEGFGLPPLEAMAHGVPVVSSNRTCLPEVLGEAAMYVDPENPEQMADVIHRGLTDQDIRFALGEQAKIELMRYSWDQLTVKTLSVYNTALMERASP